MIKLENTEVLGWEAAIRGMRNPMNSWEKSDSIFTKHLSDNIGCWTDISGTELPPCSIPEEIHEDNWTGLLYNIGANDYSLMKKLRNAGTDHRKFMRMITVYVDITAPLYWFKEFDTYKIGTVANSCSTMHKIADREFTLEDFSHEHLTPMAIAHLNKTVLLLNIYRNTYLYGGEDLLDDGSKINHKPKDKDIWWQMIQLLPSSYNQRRTVCTNYETLCNIYKSRKSHKLDEWVTFCNEWITSLPYSELITAERNETR